MSFVRGGIREICDVTFRPLQPVDFGNVHFEKMQPCLFMDTAQTSSLEGASTTVYAQGGRGNARLVAWDGEKTLTLNITDALISPISFAMLSGAGIIQGEDSADMNIVHMTYDAVAKPDKDGVTKITLEDEPYTDGLYGDVYAYILDEAGAVKYHIPGICKVEGMDVTIKDPEIKNEDTIRIDFYSRKPKTQMLTIDAENFAGYYYIEAECLWRNEADGVDYPAIITIPRGKIQTNFTFSMASSGDPSTFDFVIDCLPGYTRFDKAHKVMATVQIIDASGAAHPYHDKVNVPSHNLFEEPYGDEYDAHEDTWYNTETNDNHTSEDWGKEDEDKGENPGA